ncbi:hypothetical protein N8758_03625 [Crocinitomicaceae bacterium]|jgi:hypothetical protein|nr:hypothetical protein [Crocinitomicaceae bacterium]MDA9169310.1 hypothetical protein [Crocinitomicaceae bacterium]MDG1036088.1 hypothetical protein [Crocinitomicaceae bacterium]
MTLDGFFRGLGDVLQWTFNILENDMPTTFLVNTGAVLLGFVGLFYWLNLQRKFNAQAEKDPDQLK